MSSRRAMVSIKHMLPPGNVMPVAPRPRAVVGTGITSPEFLAFRRRIEALLPTVLELAPRAHPDMLRTPLITAALQDRQLLDATDDSLSAFLLYAAHTGLTIGKELQPVIDRDERTGAVLLVPVEGISGLTRLMKEAGARTVSSGTVYAADLFRCNVGGGMRDFVHEPNIAVRDRGPVIAFYALVDLPKHDWVAKVLTVREVQELQAASPNGNHRAWTSYFNRMGEISALRALAPLVEQGHRNPAMRGWSQPEAPEPTRPIQGLPDDPYDIPQRTAAPAADVVDADYEIVSDHEPSFKSVQDAAGEKLPGRGVHFEGWGGQPIGRCPDGILRGVLRWIALELSRATTYARLHAAITLLLQARRASGTRPSEDQTR